MRIVIAPGVDDGVAAAVRLALAHSPLSVTAPTGALRQPGWLGAALAEAVDRDPGLGTRIEMKP